MQYLNATTHSAPADTFTAAGMSHPTAWYIQKATDGNAEAIALLAQAGIVPHYPSAGPCLLGSTWELESDGWHETPSGTPGEIATALAAQEHLRLRREAWPEQTRQRKIRAANAVLADPNATSNQRIEALKTLNTL